MNRVLFAHARKVVTLRKPLYYYQQRRAAPCTP